MPNDPERKDYPYLTPPALWAKLKPLARQMRHDPTPAEDRLWERLRNRQIAGFKFRRQHSIDRFIADFYCADAQIIIEVDGAVHEYTPEEDAIRQEFLESLGFRVLRFTNDDVEQHLDVVIQAITETLRTRAV
jgi:very-short-patch-repair endonuclease